MTSGYLQGMDDISADAIHLSQAAEALPVPHLALLKTNEQLINTLQ